MEFSDFMYANENHAYPAATPSNMPNLLLKYKSVTVEYFPLYDTMQLKFVTFVFIKKIVIEIFSVFSMQDV